MPVAWDTKLKKFNLSIFFFASFLSLLITLCYCVLASLYIQEFIANMKLQEKYLIANYATQIISKEQTLNTFKKSIFGTQESFKYHIAIIDQNDQLMYTTFQHLPHYQQVSKQIYFDKDTIIYNGTDQLSDIGVVKIILGKSLDYSSVHKRIITLLSVGLLFFLGCLALIYFYLRDIYLIFSKRYNTVFRDAIHEIRTPLGVIQINLEFLENTLENSMPLKRAQGGLRNLTSIYESLEYYIKKKKVAYTKETIDLSQFLRDRIDFFQVLADIKSITIQKDIHEHCTVFMSRVELQRLLDNNLSNAIKYSKENTTFSIKLYAEKFFISLSFSNKGEQIMDVTKIFQKYYRGNDSKGGFGLGLSIVKYICELYSIEIDVVSLPNGESTFSYKIPYKNTMHV